MRHKFTNFTRGSQLLGHFGFMFAAGLKGPLLVTAATFTGLCWWRVSAALSDHESYLCWMRLYAGIYTWFEFDPAKAVNLESCLVRTCFCRCRTSRRTRSWSPPGTG